MHYSMILEALMLALALSLDALVASFAYGSKGIKIPFKSVQIINLICSGFTGLSFLAGILLRHYIPSWLAVAVSFALLLILGIVKLLDSITKSIIRKHNDLSKEIEFSLFNFKFILNLYANPEDADIDRSKSLSPAEAASLAIALSFDGITVGIGAAIGDVNGFVVFLCTLITNTGAVLLGCLLGNRLVKKSTFNMSWISGLILIALAFSKLF